jgi:hypothetical protein
MEEIKLKIKSNLNQKGVSATLTPKLRTINYELLTTN